MHLRDVFREEIHLPTPHSRLEHTHGVYAIAKGWSVVVSIDGMADVLGPTPREHLTINAALDLGLLVLKQPRRRLAKDDHLGFVGRTGDVLRWGHDGLKVLDWSGK